MKQQGLQQEFHPKSSRQFRRHAFVVVLVAITVCIATSWFGYSVVSRIVAIQERWSDYSHQMATASSTLNRIRTSFGYGGFIHNFKTLVLRREATRIPLIEENLKETYAALDEYRRLPLAAEERQALDLLRRTVDQYADCFCLTRDDYMPNGLGTAEIADRIRVEDAPALEALNFLKASVEARRAAAEAETETAIAGTIGFLRYGIILIPLILATGGSFLYFNRRLLKTTSQLRAAMAFVDGVVEGAPDAIVTTNGDGVIITANAAAEQMFDVPRWSLVGRALDEFVTDKCHCSKANATRRDGTVLPVEVTTGQILQDGDVHQVAVIRDVALRNKAEDALGFLAAIVESTDAAIIGKDLNGTIRSWNRAAEKLYGYTAEETIGRNAAMLIPADRTEEEIELMATIRQGQKVDHYETKRVRRDGVVVDVLLTLSPVANADGTITGASSIARDITDRKLADRQLEEANEFNKRLFATSPVGIIAYRSDGQCISANAAAAAIVGATVEQLTEQNFRQIESWKKSGLLASAEKAIATGAVEEREFHFVSTFGKKVYVDARLASFSVGDDCYLLLMVSDVTTQIKAQEALEEAKRAAEAASRAKTDFLANMSHEIRTPMNAILGMTHLSLQTELTGKQRDYLEKIEVSGNSLLGIINDILDLSKIEAGKLDLEATDFILDDIVSHVASVASMTSGGKDIEILSRIAADVPIEVSGDPLRLRQVLLNLVGNAVKFTHEGEIVILTDLVERSADRVTLSFSIRDTGIGIPPEHQARLFEAFSQGDTSTTRKYGGTGLGLSISKNLVNLMGGELFVESVPGEGSTFRFTASFGLRRDRLFVEKRPRKEGRPVRVMVVDDNATAREILEELIRSFGFEVTALDGGAACIAELTRACEAGEHPYDVIFMDWKMPEMNGIDTVRLIKSDRRLHVSPTIIMVTAYGRDQIIREAEAAKVDGFLLKPVSPSLLLDTILSTTGYEVASPAAPRETGPDPRLADKRILLVEDNQINRQVATAILKVIGVAVDTAADGSVAVAKLAAGEMYDMILMDLQMPNMDGFEATRVIRQELGQGAVPIIAMTANVIGDIRKRCVDAGMNDHLGKPIDPELLQASVLRWAAGEAEPVGQAKVAAIKQGGFPKIPGVDVAAGLKRLNQDTAMYRRLLLRFADDQAKRVEYYQELAQSGMNEALREAVHTLKGTAGNLGIYSVYDAAKAADAAMATAGADAVIAEVSLLGRTLYEVAAEIRKLGREAGGAAEVPDEGDPADTLRELSQCLKAQSLRAESLLPRLRSQLKGRGFDSSLHDLEEAVHRLDFAAALTHLDPISTSISSSVRSA